MCCISWFGSSWLVGREGNGDATVGGPGTLYGERARAGRRQSHLACELPLRRSDHPPSPDESKIQGKCKCETRPALRRPTQVKLQGSFLNLALSQAPSPPPSLTLTWKLCKLPLRLRVPLPIANTFMVRQGATPTISFSHPHLPGREMIRSHY